MKIELEEGDLVLCVVEKISGTSIFVRIEDNGEGSIVTSEIAPGRIRNIRDYVVPGKRIVCKILSIDSQGNINLSLRRVSGKEKKEVLEKYEKEKNSLSILRSVVKEKAEEIAEKVKVKEKSLYEFLQNCKTSPQELEKYLSKDETLRLCKILQEKKEKEKEVKREFNLTSKFPDGLTRVKKILLDYKENITYIASGRFMIKIKAENYKIANLRLQKILEEIEEKADKEDLEFEVKEK